LVEFCRCRSSPCAGCPRRSRHVEAESPRRSACRLRQQADQGPIRRLPTCDRRRIIVACISAAISWANRDYGVRTAHLRWQKIRQAAPQSLGSKCLPGAGQRGELGQDVWKVQHRGGTRGLGLPRPAPSRPDMRSRRARPPNAVEWPRSPLGPCPSCSRGSAALSDNRPRA